MKTRFLDPKNCHALLPKLAGFSIIKHLEKCLTGINNTTGSKPNQIDDLVENNKATIGRSCGSMRYLDSPIEVSLALYPNDGAVHAQALEGPPEGPAKLHIVYDHDHETTWKIILPLQFLLKGWGDAESGHQCYVHTISKDMPRRVPVTDANRLLLDDKNYYYVGITGRNWLLRLSEHLREASRGSHKTFHRTWRDSLQLDDILFTSSSMDINMTYEQAMHWEERGVEKFAYGANGLNMIPGGFEGLKHLHKHRLIQNTDINLEERETAILRYLAENPRKGIPNPLISEKWKDDEYYLKVNESHKNRLSADQVRSIRRLSKSGYSIDQIVDKTKALNNLQVEKVLKGKTYSRVK